MSRMIDADAFIEMMEEKCDTTKFADVMVLTICKGAIDKMPTVNQWIPVSERLPELKEWVLVSSGDCVVSDCLVVRGGNKIWYECGRIDIESDAWMPLPSPYKEDT